jgi:hypothetical protein
MPKVIAIYLNLLYSRADIGHFFGQISATLLTDSEIACFTHFSLDILN